MKMKNLLKLFKKPQSSAGYTLVELLIAASATLVVIGAAGFGLVSTMQAIITGKTQVERRNEVNRGLDFISDEVRLAKEINTDPSTAFNEAKADGKLTFNPPLDAEPVLALNIPGVGDEVLYYVSSPATSNRWIGPKVIYRFGPPLDSNGQYTNKDNPSAWRAEPLIDRVDDNSISLLSCTDGKIEAKGFAACVNINEKMAQLYMNGKFNPDPDDIEVYKATTNVFARAGSNPGSETPPSLPSKPPCSVVEGKLDCGDDSDDDPGGDTKLTVQVLKSDYSCNLSGLKWAVKTEIEITKVNKDGPLPDKPNVITIESGDDPKEITISAKPDPVPTDPNVIWDEVKLRSVPELPGGVTSCDNEANIIEHALDSSPKTTNQTAALEAGDDLGKVSIQGVPIADLTGFEPQDNPQKSVVDSLQDQGYIENKTTKLSDKLSDNQQIILFEIGKKETSYSGFDAQDNIVLVTTESL